MEVHPGAGVGEGMSKSETGLQSLGQGSRIRTWNGEGWAGSSMWSSENGTKVCGWMGYAVEGLRTSSGRGDVWIRVLVQCYTECNTKPEEDKSFSIKPIDIEFQGCSRIRSCFRSL